MALAPGTIKAAGVQARAAPAHPSIGQQAMPLAGQAAYPAVGCLLQLCLVDEWRAHISQYGSLGAKEAVQLGPQSVGSRPKART